MKRMAHRHPVWIIAALLMPSALVVLWAGGMRLRRVSLPGDYQGYCVASYDGWTRDSHYLTVRDGTQLAVDIYHPTLDGRTTSARLPVLWGYERYHRADNAEDGTVRSNVTRSVGMQRIIRHGYVIAQVDVRGSGASFGRWMGPFAPQEAQDVYDVTEWLAAQSWCDGNVGMIGRSYAGIIQYLAAAQRPPHLRAIFPEMAMFDLYEFVYPGGILREGFGLRWSENLRRLDVDCPAAAVDEDVSGDMLRRAVVEHQANLSSYELFSSLPLRDSRGHLGLEDPYSTCSPSSWAPQINRSRVAIYHLAGWYDLWCRDALLWYHNLDTTQKLIIGPWCHTDTSGFSKSTEQLRWFDYWLKGIDNGIANEAPIHYFTMGARPGKEWQAAWQWPLPEQRLTDYYFANDGAVSPPDPPGSSHGLLSTQAPPAQQTTWTVDVRTTSGGTSRWVNGYGGPFGYGDLSGNDALCVTYTSEPLPAELEITGHPVLHVWLTCTQPDVDLVAYLERVEGAASYYVTEGCLRASHRAVAEASFETMGLPFHPGTSLTVRALPAEPQEMTLDLLPTSVVFHAGDRIRVTLAGADRDNLKTLAGTEASRVVLYHGEEHPSRIVLPVIPVRRQATPAGANLPSGLPGWLVIVSVSGFVGCSVWWLRRRSQDAAAVRHTGERLP